MEPMLAVFRNGKAGVVFFGKRRDRFVRGERVISSVQNISRNTPFDRVLTYITKILPRQILTECGRDDILFFQLTLGHIYPRHHVTDQPLHIDDR